MILRTELRRSAAPVAGIGFLVVSLAFLYSLSGPWHKDTAPWDEQWTGLAQWSRYLALFMSPLVIGVGAWQGMRDRRSGVPELFATTPRAAWRRVLPTAAALGTALTAGYVALLVVGGVQVAGTASYFPLGWLPVAGVMVLALVATALLGAGLGRLVPSLVTPPVLAVAALAGHTALAVAQGWPQLLTPVFTDRDISVFTAVSPTVTLTQALWFVGLGATGFGLFFAAGARTRLLALLPVVLAGAVAVPVLAGVDGAVVADPGARALVCDDDGPRVCVTRAHADYLPTLVTPAREALALMEKLPDPPTSVVELPPDEQVPAGVAPVHLRTDPRTDPTEVALAVLAGSDAPDCEGSDPYRTSVARTVVGSWLAGELGPVPGLRFLWDADREGIEREWRELTALPPAEQATEVAALRAAAVNCEGTP